MTSRRWEDLRRTLAGVAAVAQHGVADSTLLRRLANGDLIQGPCLKSAVARAQPVKHAVQRGAYQQQHVQQQGGPPTPAVAHAQQAASAAAAPAAAALPAAPAAARTADTVFSQEHELASTDVIARGQIAAVELGRAAPEQPPASRETGGSGEPEVHGLQGVALFGTDGAAHPSSSQATAGEPAGAGPAAAAGAEASPRKFVPRERAVPSSSIGRVLGFAQLGSSLLYGTVRESVSRALGGGAKQPDSAHPASSWLTEDNAERLANALCRMRGAALKLGQMLSIQDEAVLPPQFQAALERVRAGADVMPRRQLEQVLVSELGPDWRSKVADFDFHPMAAASIGQVHSVLLHDGRRAVMKVQYPGVARSIESDVDNLMRLISVANVLPKGLYVENAVRVAKAELRLECDYRYELQSQQRFKQLIASDPYTAQHFYVPDAVPELSTEQVLTSEWVPGVHIDKVAAMPQAVRDEVGTKLLALTLKELFQWRYMQTDPNWGNFLYDASSGMINLIDFGAARDYPPHFVSEYLHMVRACADRDRQQVIQRSATLGFLTGDESAVMLDAHVEAGYLVGVPFGHPGIYDFGSHGGMTRRVSELGSVMLKHRLTPPPDHSYSLHRKLSGAFLACIKLKARVPCRQLFLEAFDAHERLAAHEAQHALEAQQHAVQEEQRLAA